MRLWSFDTITMVLVTLVMISMVLRLSHDLVKVLAQPTANGCSKKDRMTKTVEATEEYPGPVCSAHEHLFYRLCLPRALIEVLCCRAFEYNELSRINSIIRPGIWIR
jgi:hypothetical protein